MRTQNSAAPPQTHQKYIYISTCGIILTENELKIGNSHVQPRLQEINTWNREGKGSKPYLKGRAAQIQPSVLLLQQLGI